MQVTRRSERGMAILETAIVLPVLLLVLFAIIELGIGFARLQVVQNAAREGARAAVLYRINCNTGAVEAAVAAAVGEFRGTLGMSAVRVDEVAFPEGGDACTAPLITVRTSFAHEIPLTSAIGSMFGGGASFITLPGASTAATQPRSSSAGS